MRGRLARPPSDSCHRESGIVQGLRRGEQVLKVKVEVKGQTKILYSTLNNPATLPYMFVCVLFAISL